MEEELKEACKAFVSGDLHLIGLKRLLKNLLDQANEDEMLEFCHTVIEGLSESRGH